MSAGGHRSFLLPTISRIYGEYLNLRFNLSPVKAIFDGLNVYIRRSISGRKNPKRNEKLRLQLF